MWGVGRGLQARRTPVGVWFALEAGVAADWQFSRRLQLRAQFVLARPLLAPDFTVGEHTSVHSPASVLLRTGLALGLLF
jgi:hypothetical protein